MHPQDQLESLLNQQVHRVPKEIWSDELKQQFVRQLATHQVDDLKVYRDQESGDYILCIRGYVPPNINLVKVYEHRSKALAALPLFALVCLIFAFTALIARDLSLMMSAEFLVILPFLIGALSQYYFSYKQTNSFGSMVKQQSTVLMVCILASIFVLAEGIICIIMASPFIFLWQLSGAVIMRILCHSFWTPSVKVYSLSVVPLILMWLDPFASSSVYSTTKNEIIIAAPVNHVFDAINQIKNIKEEEIKPSPIFLMGFPKPLSGMTVQEGDGLTRQIHWQRGIYFEEAITHYEPNQLLAWTYRFTPESFPKGSLDDHVEIGGQYFDLASTDYRLEALTPNSTKLTLTIDYRLSTEINWYSKLWADYVLNEFSDVVLNVYKKRLEEK